MKKNQIISLESEAGFKALFEHSIVAILVVDKDGKIKLLNPSAEKLFGYAVKELAGQPLEILLPDHLRKKHATHRQDYFASPTTRPMGLELELSAKKKDGTIFPVEVGLGHYSINGENLAISFIKDITAEKYSSRKFETLFYDCPAGNILSDSETGLITDVNDFFCSMTGYSSEELIGKTSIELGILSADQRQMLVGILQKEGRIFSIELPIRNKQHEEVQILMSAEILDMSGKKYFLSTCIDVTQLKKERDARREKDEQIRLLLENMHEYFVVVEPITDEKGNVTDVRFLEINAAAEITIGKKRQEVIGRLRSEVFGPLSEEKVKQYTRVIQSKDPIVGEAFFLLSDTWVESHSYFRDGKIFSFGFDVTRRKLAEDRYRLLFEAVQEAFVVQQLVTDESGNVVDLRFVEMNQEAEKLFGMQAKDIIGQSRSVIFGPLDPKTKDIITRVLNAEKVTTERYFALKDKWLLTRIYPTQPGFIASLNLDITAQKKAEIQLKEESEWLQLLNDSVRRLWNTTNLKDGLEEILSTALKLMKADKGNVQLIDPERQVLLIAAQSGFHKAFLDHFREVTTKSGSVCGIAFRDRKQIVVEDVQTDPLYAEHQPVFNNEGIHAVQSTPFFDHQGAPIGMVSTHSSAPDNFTVQGLQKLEIYARYAEGFLERMRVQEAMKKINVELEEKVKERTLELTQSLEREKELNEMKSRFVSMASHEFRTPLTSILSSISLIDMYHKDEHKEKRDKHIARIKGSVNNLVDILNDFLSLEKLEQGKVEIAKDSFDLARFGEDIVEEMQGMLKQGQKIVFHAQGETAVAQDKKILRNILLNLLSNAIKYSAEDKEIYFSIDVTDNVVTIKVKDEGIGIPEDEQRKLFDKFFRASNAVNIQGTGLGLNIVKRYAELLDGAIDFVSKYNHGTTFTIQFPQNKD